MYANAVKAQGRVLLALMLHEATTRYGGSRLGYLWALVEPVVYITVLVLIRRGVGGHVPIGNSMFVFVATGTLPFFLFRNVAGKVSSGLSANDALLTYPVVKPPDVVLGRALLEGATLLLVCVIVFGSLQEFSGDALPNDYITVLSALSVLFSLGMSVGLLISLLQAFFPSIAMVTSVFLRMLYWFSGVFYLPSSLPPSAIAYLKWNPLLHCIEWFRVGFYPRYTSYVLSVQYAVVWALALALVAFASERLLRAQMSSK